jgi:hypothetical protein
MGEDFAHNARQRGAMEIADRHEAAALRLRGRVERHAGRDLGEADGQLKVKVGESVLDQAGHAAPFGV